MVGRKKKTKKCDKVSPKEDRLSQLPESLRSEILCHLSTKDAVRTSALSTKWRNLCRSVPDLDLRSSAFSNFHAFVNHVQSFLDSHRESWIRRLKLYMIYSFYGKSFLTKWIDAVTKRKIQHLDIDYDGAVVADEVPVSIYTCKTLVHLRLFGVTLASADSVSLPCLKFMYLAYNTCRSDTTLQKLISGSPVLEDLTIIRPASNDPPVLQVRSRTLKTIHINESTHVVIDAPLLQCLKTTVSPTKNFQIVNVGLSAKLDINVYLSHRTTNVSSVIHDILKDIPRFRELVIGNGSHIWKDIVQYSKSGPVLQFCNLSRLHARFSKFDLEMLPTILESCPKLESFILEVVEPFALYSKNLKEPKVMFSTVPRCLVSSLKFVEMKRSISKYKGEKELVRYFLKNSTMLKRLMLNVHITRNVLKEIVAMPRCSSACEVIVL